MILGSYPLDFSRTCNIGTARWPGQAWIQKLDFAFRGNSARAHDDCLIGPGGQGIRIELPDSNSQRRKVQLGLIFLLFGVRTSLNLFCPIRFRFPTHGLTNGSTHRSIHGFDPWVRPMDRPMGRIHGSNTWVEPMGRPMGRTYGSNLWVDPWVEPMGRHMD